MRQQSVSAQQSLLPQNRSSFLDNSHEQSNRKITCLPLEFQYIPVEILSKQFTKLNNPHPYRIHYLGPRYKNTLQLHKKNCFSDKKPHVYNSQLFGNYQPNETQKSRKSKQLSINLNKLQSSSQQEQKATIQKDQLTVLKSVSQNIAQEEQLVERYKVDMKKIVHSYMLEEKLKNSQFFRNNVYYRAFQGMNPSLNLSEQFVFNSCFEGGNLDCVIKLSQREFDLFLRIDSNTRGHLLWFYFSVKNHQKLGKIKMNICNFSKSKTLYKEGLKPYIFSSMKNKKQAKGWQQSGQNLGLQKRELKYEILENKYNSNSTNCLVIEYDFEYENDEVFFAYCIPYTYSQLMNDIDKLPEKYVEKRIMGKSLLGTDIPILHITEHNDLSSDKIPKEQVESTTSNIPSDHDQFSAFQNKQKKRVIFATGRIHPSQSNSSYVIMGFIKWLCSQQKQAVQIRKIARFVIVPMVNPDGVIIGNSRTSASGKDLNRQYINPDPSLHPEICLIKELAKKIHQQYEIKLFLDFHGHSRKKNTFFYGPVYNISEPNYYKCRILPKMIEKISNPFRYHSCSFNLIEQKKKTARASMFQSLGIQFTYTVESSIGYYYDCELLKIFEFSQIQWCKMGAAIAQGTSLFIVGIDSYEQILTEKRKQRLKKKRFYRHPQAKVQYLEDQMFADIQTGEEPLRIAYEDKDASISPKNSQKSRNSNIFLQMLQEIKISSAKKPQKNSITSGKEFDPKDLDVDQDSDSHDQNQDMEAKRLKEFTFFVKKQTKSLNVINKQKHNYEVKFSGDSSNNSKKMLKSNNNKLINEFELLNEIQKANKIKLRNVKTGDCLRSKLKQVQFRPNDQGQGLKQKTLPEQLNDKQQSNEQASNNLQAHFNKHSQKRPIYTSIKRQKKNQQSIQKRQKTIGNYFGQYRLLISQNKIEGQKKKQKYDIIRKLQSRKQISRKKRTQSSNQIKTHLDIYGSLPMNNSNLCNKMQKCHPNEVIHRPTQFTFFLPFSQVADTTKSHILKPKLKIHIKQKPHSLQNFHNSVTVKERQSSINMKQKSQKAINDFFQSHKDSGREKKVSQSYLIQHGVGQFFNRSSHTSQKPTGRQSNRCTKIDLGDVKNSSLINTLKIYHM